MSGKHTKEQLKIEQGAREPIDLLGTGDLREVERRIDAGDTEAALVFEALSYRIGARSRCCSRL